MNLRPALTGATALALAVVGLAPGTGQAATVRPATVAAPAASPSGPEARVRALLPADAVARVRARAAAHGVDVAPTEAAVRAAIDPDRYQCAPTVFFDYMDQQMKDWTQQDMEILLAADVLSWPALDALFFGADEPQYFGADGEDTHVVVKTFDRLKRFWDIPSDDIRLAAMHGDVVMDRARMMRLLTQIYGLDAASAGELLDVVQPLLAEPRFDGGRNPLFTFNAFASSDQGQPADQQLGLPDTIILGDGLGEAAEELGFGDVEPQATLAHEFGHQIQFELGVLPDPADRRPESTRAVELEADALAGYYLTHPQGERLRTKRVVVAVSASYAFGDCAFDNPGHHGTPNQRAAATVWGAELGDARGAKGHVLGSRTVVEAFRAALPQIVAPDLP